MRSLTTRLVAGWGLYLCLLGSAAGDELPGTQPLTESGDLAAKMVEGIDRYLMRALAASVERRQERWKVDDSSLEAYRKSIEPQRQRLRKILGAIDPRVPNPEMEFIGYVHEPAPAPLRGRQLSRVAETDTYRVHEVRWPVLPGMDGEG